MNSKAYLRCMYCKVKNWIQRVNQVIQSDQEVHVYGCGRHGNVDTRLGMGASYYHIRQTR
jgi:hypothetical protein